MRFPPFIDLESLTSTLSKSGKHATLHKALLQVWRAESCLGDLIQAKQCCEVLSEYVRSGTNDINPAQHITEKALLATGLLLYARATATSGKLGERGSIRLERGQLTKEQWHDHEVLIDLRNQALAHVNPKHTTGTRIWHRVILFAVRSPRGSWRPAAATNETGFHRETYERLERMLPIASALILDKFKHRIATFSAKLQEAHIDEEEFLRHRIDPVATFGSEAAVRRLLAGSPSPSDAFWVTD